MGEASAGPVKSVAELLASLADALARLSVVTLQLSQMVKKDRSLNQKE